MKVLVACDKFRGSLTAREANTVILDALGASALDASGAQVAIADGGEGTLDALADAGFERKTTTVAAPFGGTRSAPWGYDPATRRAVIEMAAVAGHDAATAGYDPDLASTAGLGELIVAALAAGARDIIVAVGGSITVDGGAGALEALGARYHGASGPLVRPAGRALADIERIDLAELDPRLAETRITLAADVDNPLTGPNGAAHVFGPQKGVAADDVDAFDRALAHFDQRLAEARGSAPLADTAAAGAAGGVMVGLAAAAPTHAVDGFSLVFEQHRLEARIAEADLIVTGEGSLDTQSLSGKGPVAIARAAMAAGKPVLVLAGRVAVPPAELAAHGITAAFAIGRGPAALPDALANARGWLAETARSAFDCMAIGRGR